MRTIKYILVTLFSVGVVACGGGSESSSVASLQPAGTVAVNITVDDTANMVYQAGDLLWKGSFIYDSTTRVVSLDSGWTNPYVPLYDDGPWTGNGHEPAGAIAGDHKWGMTVFVAPAAGTLNFEYGLVDHSASDSWIWVGPNGTFSVAPAATAAITVTGQTFALFGTTDVKLELDTNALGAGPWDLTTVKVKGSAWHWSLITLADDGTNGDAAGADGIYTFVLSQYAGAGKTYPHVGLPNAGDILEFVYELNGVEYKSAGDAISAGVTAAEMQSISWTPLAVTVNPATHNTGITVQ